MTNPELLATCTRVRVAFSSTYVIAALFPTLPARAVHDPFAFSFPRNNPSPPPPLVVFLVIASNRNHIPEQVFIDTGAKFTTVLMPNNRCEYAI